MKIILCGGSGQVGTLCRRAFAAAGHDVVILTRKTCGKSSEQNVRHVEWDAKNVGDWATEFNDADVVINLAGRSVNCRYHQRNRRAIIDSRVQSNHVVGDAIGQAKSPPRLWLQMSTATIYAHRFDAPNDEATGILGGGETEQGAPDTWKFSIDVARAWEKSCLEMATPQTRKVLLRSAVVMSPDAGGVFDVLLRLVRFGLGGRQDDGRQFVSWIHEADFVSALNWLIDHDEIEGPVNLASPHPLPNAEFMRTLRDAWGARVGLPAAKWMLEVGAFFLRTETELILKSRRVIPGRLHDTGFEFQFPEWRKAASELVARWRQWRKHPHRRVSAQLSNTQSQLRHGAA